MSLNFKNLAVGHFLQHDRLVANLVTISHYMFAEDKHNNHLEWHLRWINLKPDLIILHIHLHVDMCEVDHYFQLLREETEVYPSKRHSLQLGSSTVCKQKQLAFCYLCRKITEKMSPFIVFLNFKL